MVLHNARLSGLEKAPDNVQLGVFSVLPISRVVLNSGDCIEVLIIIIILLLVKGYWGLDWVLISQVGFEGYIKD
jgi:hypothetical protein